MTDAGADGTLQQILGCIALHPDLRTLLLLDATHAQMTTTAHLFARYLHAAVGRPVAVHTLDTVHDETALWGSAPGEPFREGLLTGDGRNWRVIAVPNLAGLNLLGTRACLQVIGHPRVDLQRFGRRASFVPRIAWLVGCAAADLPTLSPHLLDRLPLRVHAGIFQPGDRVALLRSLLAANGPEPLQARPELIAAIKRGRAVLQQTTDTAWAATLPACMKDPAPKGVRRYLALARFTAAFAALMGRTATAADMPSAARLLRLPVTSAEAPPADLPRPARPEPMPDLPAMEVPEPAPEPVIPDTAPHQAPVATGLPDSATPAPVHLAEAVTLTPDLYAEDHLPPGRDTATLQTHTPIHDAGLAKRGPVIGTRRAHRLHDIAVLPTLLAALPFQRVRRARRPGQGLLLAKEDLRAWRRAGVADAQWVLLLDFTALHGRDWASALAPLLGQAYQARARLDLILVGAEGAPRPFGAEYVAARGVLDPAVRHALNREPGRATPLADGLRLALERLLAGTHGRDHAVHRRLVVLTDGRGNIPLETSRSGRLTGPVGIEGVEDALAVAQRIGCMRRVDTLFLNPAPDTGKHLVDALVEALQPGSVIPLQEVDDYGHG